MLDKRRLAVLVILSMLLACAGWSYLQGGIVSQLASINSESADRVRTLKTFFESWGILAPVIYVLFVTVEVVVAPIPGTLLYLPGGMVFGWFWGGTLALIGNVLGAGVSCLLVRSVAGQAWTESLFTSQSLKRFQELIERRGLWIVVLLRINPLTSSDLVSYAAGFTRIRLGTLMLGTFFGMAPLCYLQALLSEELFAYFPWLVWPLLVICGIYTAVVVVVVRRLVKKQAANIPAVEVPD